jgi:putative ABC transport system permease protein
VLQALLLTSIAYAIGSGLSRFLAPLMPMQTEISGLTYVVLAGVALVVAVVASLAGVRRAISVDPALAFGGN